METAPDFEVAGIVRRNGAANLPLELTNYKVVKDIKELADVDVAILACPTRSCPEYAKMILPLGINTVDSFDIHTSILDYRRELMPINKETNTVSVIAAGWDPGSDSIVRTLMESLAPKGLSYTNFGPGMSMGHSVCVRSKKGVKNALSVTIPLGEGIHRRMVYVELEDGFTLEQVTAEIKADPYFANDETHVFAVDSVDQVRDMGHGVHLVRKGVSGKTQNQRMEFNMSINNPALTDRCWSTWPAPRCACNQVAIPWWRSPSSTCCQGIGKTGLDIWYETSWPDDIIADGSCFLLETRQDRPVAFADDP